MKIKFKINRQVNIQPAVLEEKINKYLEITFYHIIQKGVGFIIFKEDDFSDRKKARSDFYTRIGEGKFVIKSFKDNETSVKLIYFTSINYYVFLVMLASGFGIYTNDVIMPIVFSIVLFIPIIIKFYYIKENMFDKILEI